MAAVNSKIINRNLTRKSRNKIFGVYHTFNLLKHFLKFAYDCLRNIFIIFERIKEGEHMSKGYTTVYRTQLYLSYFSLRMFCNSPYLKLACTFFCLLGSLVTQHFKNPLKLWAHNFRMIYWITFNLSSEMFLDVQVATESSSSQEHM